MKKSLILTFGLLTLISFTGCKHGPVGVTDIPGNRPGAMKPDDNSGKLPTPHENDNPTGIGFKTDENNPYAAAWTGPHTEDHDKFAANTVHFTVDSAAIKEEYRAKL